MDRCTDDAKTISPRRNQEIHVLFEHGSENKNTENEPCIICMTLYTKSSADQTDHFADVFYAKTLHTVMTML